MNATTLERLPRAGKIARMAKKISGSGGPHKTPRVAVQIPEPWMKVLRRLAAKTKQPSLWYLLALIGGAAEADGTERPAYPWEEET
jgi:hypothetical protein